MKTSSKRIKDSGHKLYIILEHANLELTKDKKNPEIINSDDHMNLIKKMNKSYEDYRPDVLHQCLLNLFESPLNKSGMLQVYMRTKENVLIEINPKTKTYSFSFFLSNNKEKNEEYISNYSQLIINRNKQVEKFDKFMLLRFFMK